MPLSVLASLLYQLSHLSVHLTSCDFVESKKESIKLGETWKGMSQSLPAMPRKSFDKAAEIRSKRWAKQSQMPRLQCILGKCILMRILTPRQCFAYNQALQWESRLREQLGMDISVLHSFQCAMKCAHIPSYCRKWEASKDAPDVILLHVALWNLEFVIPWFGFQSGNNTSKV